MRQRNYLDDRVTGPRGGRRASGRKRLSTGQKEITQAKFDSLPFGLQARCPERVPHQLIVDHDVRSHDVYVH